MDPLIPLFQASDDSAHEFQSWSVFNHYLIFSLVQNNPQSHLRLEWDLIQQPPLCQVRMLPLDHVGQTVRIYTIETKYDSKFEKTFSLIKPRHGSYDRKLLLVNISGAKWHDQYFDWVYSSKFVTSHNMISRP